MTYVTGDVKNMKCLVSGLLIFIAITISACFQDDSRSYSLKNKVDSFSIFVDATGNISKPTKFRENWTHLGSWFVTSDGMNTGASIHDVYATPESVSHFNTEGQWPDGAVLIKTVSNIKSQSLTTGKANWANNVDVWFVMIRDRKGRFPNNAAWGEGWGWGLFYSDEPEKNVATSWKGDGFSNCFGCHLPAKDTEWVYIDGYPTVRSSQKYSK